MYILVGGVLFSVELYLEPCVRYLIKCSVPVVRYELEF